MFGVQRAFLLLSVTVSLIELVHMYNIKYNHDNTIKKKKEEISAFALLHVSWAKNEFKYFPNWQLKDWAHLYFRLDSTNGGRCGDGESDGETAR